MTRGTRRSSNQALPSPMAAPVAAAVSSRARWVGTRRTIQCTSKAATIQPPVIQSAVLTVRRVRRETLLIGGEGRAVHPRPSVGAGAPGSLARPLSWRDDLPRPPVPALPTEPRLQVYQGDLGV